MAQTSQEATVWMTYVNIVDGVDEDFRDMKAHGIQGVEINTSPAIWVGDEIEPAQALERARRHGLQLAFTIENITLRADRIASHGITPTPCVMIGGAYEGEAIDWHRFSFTPQRHEILIEKPIFGADWTLGNGSYFAELLPPHHAEVIVKEKDYDGAQHLLILPATIEPRDEHTYLMEFDLTGARGDLDNVMLAVYWRMRGPIYEQPQPSNYFGNTASPHAAGTVEGFCAQIKQEIARWTEANGGTFPSDVVMGIRLGDEDFLQTVPNGPANPAQSMPLWDYSDDAIVDFERLNSDDTYPRHWTYREAFGEPAYADWMWSLHRACAGLLRAAKDELRQEGLGALKTYRNLTRCNSFYVGNDHGGMSLDMSAREIDIVSADPYPASDRGFNDGSIPGDMGYVAGLARRHGKELMPWMQGTRRTASVSGSPQSNLRTTHRARADTDYVSWLRQHRATSGGHGRHLPRRKRGLLGVIPRTQHSISEARPAAYKGSRRRTARLSRVEPERVRSRRLPRPVLCGNPRRHFRTIRDALRPDRDSIA